MSKNLYLLALSFSMLANWSCNEEDKLSYAVSNVLPPYAVPADVFEGPWRLQLTLEGEPLYDSIGTWHVNLEPCDGALWWQSEDYDANM